MLAPHDGEAPVLVGRLMVVVVVAASLSPAACASPPPPTGTCGEVLGGPDGGVLAGLSWQPGAHALGTSAPVYACIHAGAGDRVRLAVSGSATVHVSPDPATASAETYRVPLYVVVDGPGDAVLRLVVTGSREDKPRLEGAEVARVRATASGWQLLVPPPG
jgi:hypothetical protein